MSGQASFDFAPPRARPAPAPTPAARATDPETSRQAADRAQVNAKTNRALALRTLAERGLLTDFELAAATGVSQTSIGKRRGELVKDGLAAATAERRPSPTGSPAIVWTLTDKGRALARTLEGGR